MARGAVDVACCDCESLTKTRFQERGQCTSKAKAGVDDSWVLRYFNTRVVNFFHGRERD